MRALRLVLLSVALPLLCLPSPSHGASYFGDSFCKITSIQDVSSFHLSLQFKTSRRSGLLLLAAGMQDYLFLELQNGKLQVSINTCLSERILIAMYYQTGLTKPT
uniref:Laminin G domain-containing protein n=1 Tax=Hucho hucho TaxID=62062 RepID=A0A4W5QCX8_9TELE